MTRWRALSYAALLGACGVPDLDTKGNIRCGADGACPDGYQCRIGRCCPAGAACPSLPAGTPGAPCTTAMCPLSIDGRSVSGVCLPSFPGGYCTVVGCDVSNGAAACGAFAACFAGGGNTFCLRRCTFDPERPQPQPCRDLAGEVAAGELSRYVCVKDPLDRSLAAGLCVPDCTRLNYCGTNTACDATTRSCVPIDCRRAAGVCEPMGQSCDDANGSCFRCSDQRTAAECTRAGRPCATTLGGQCRQRCNATTPCPTGATCVLGFCSR